MGDAWEFGPGADSGWNFAGDVTPYGSGGDWFSGAMGGLTSLLGYAGKTYADTWSQKTLMQQNQQGQAYIEGQRLAQQQMLLGQGGIPPLLLLAGGAVLLVVLLKD